MFDVLKSPIDVPWLSETMTTETTKILIILLNGPNYATWKVQCKLALMKEGLWNFVTGDENAPENQGEQAKYLLRRDRALVTTVLFVDPTLLYLLGADPENPAVVWKKLADQSQKEEDIGEKIGSTKNVVQFEAER